jgi:general secretion pathway protein K
MSKMNKMSKMSKMKFSRQRGIALIIVLWIITLLSVIALSFAHTMRTDVNVVANSMSRVKAEALANAALERSIYELAKPQNIEGRWNADGSSREWQYRDVTVTITMQDETGRIDINRTSDGLMRGLLLSQGLVEEDALRLVDTIADWRDQDSQKRLRGAEAPDYTAAGLNYGPANQPFQSAEELKLVLGMTPELYARLAPLITVYSGQPGINEQIASREVLRALPNVNDEQIDEYLARRDLARAQRLPIPQFQQNVFRSLSNNFTPTRIRADAVFTDGNRFVREVVVRRYTDPKRPYAYLSWKEGRDLETAVDAMSLAGQANGNNPAIGAAATAGNNFGANTSTLGKPISPNKAP